jgi:Icc-related predicted phosphoesterase
MKIVFISDTHGMHRKVKVPDGDVLIHAGDITRGRNPSSLEDFNDFMGLLPHRHKILIAGNHDFCFQNNKNESIRVLTNFTYLEDSSIEIEGINFWGTPWQPWFLDYAFNIKESSERKKKWDLIPEDTDILITHSPPHKILDKTFAGIHAGCEELGIAVKRIKPKVHIFGHIHEGYGSFTNGDTNYINASVCTRAYEPVNPPVEYNFNKE